MEYRVALEMTAIQSDFLSGTLFLVAGALLLVNLDRIVEFDQNSGVRLKHFFRRKLGDSPLNREVWSVGTLSGFRSSRIAIRIVGVVLVIVGVAHVFLAFRRYPNLRQPLSDFGHHSHVAIKPSRPWGMMTTAFSQSGHSENCVMLN
jgi:hypothetical protein